MHSKCGTLIQNAHMQLWRKKRHCIRRGARGTHKKQKNKQIFFDKLNFY